MPGPAVVVLAAGMGSRFGGPKQLTPVGPEGETLLDFVAGDAARSGFERVVVVTRSELEAQVRGVTARWPVASVLAFQDRDTASAYPAVTGRTKPLGTAHAVALGAEHADGPFAVANADDVYGAGAFAALAAHLTGPSQDDALVGYPVRNTLLSDSTVNRALCTVEGGRLTGIEEGEVRTRTDGSRAWVGPDREVELTGDEPVSTNLWGFRSSVAGRLRAAVEAFVAAGAPPAGEVLLPNVVGAAIAAGDLRVAVLPTDERCFGLTHPDDLATVRTALRDRPAWG